jgi:hypothetical protein
MSCYEPTLVPRAVDAATNAPRATAASHESTKPQQLT